MPEAPAEAAPRGHSVESLAAAIRAEIMAGNLSAGQRINQDEWAERMSLSRTPVRLALERLESQGLVRLLPRRGAVVVELTAALLDDILASRLVLESALGRAGAAQLTDAELRTLRKINGEITAVKLPDEHRALTEPTHRFHDLLFRAAQTQMMQRFVAQAVDHSHVFLNQYWYANRRIAQVTKLYYDQLLAACQARDLKRVETIIRDHRIDLAGVILQDRVKVSELQILPSLLNSDELVHLIAIVEKGDEPWGPA